MATYQFKCVCGAVRLIEASVKADTPKPVCECGEPMVRVYTAPSVTFRGGGWGRDS